MAATGTPTPNLGLRIPVGTDPASVDDINYNSNVLDTKIGAVGNTSVKDQLDHLSYFHVGDTYQTLGGNFPFRSLANLTGIYFAIRLPKLCGTDVTGVTVTVTQTAPCWYSGGNIGEISSGATPSNVSINARGTVNFSVPTSQTISTGGFGISSLNVTITFT